MKKTSEHLSYLIYIILGVFMALIFKYASAAPYNETGDFHGINFNLFVYVAALACAFVLWLLLRLLTLLLTGRAGGKRSAEAGEETGGLSGAARFADALLYGVYGAAAAGILLLIYEIYANENNLWPGTASPSYLRQEVNHRIYFLVIVLIAGILFLVLARDGETRKNRRFRVGLAGIFALLNAIATFCPNIFKDNGGGVPHIHAVLNSIVNVAHFRPYDELNCSIYGHFGLIFMPFVKVLGNDLTGIMLAISLFTFITFLAAFYVADKLVRSDSVYLIVLAAITGTTTIFTRRGQYYQINPLRLLFPMLMLAAVTFSSLQKTGKKILLSRILEYVIGILAVVWNFETGLFCVAVCAAVKVFRSLYGRKLIGLHTFVMLLRAVLYAAVCLAGAYLTVNGYNLLTGGGFNSLKLFIYPLFSGTYNVNNLRVPLPSVEFLYFFQILLFFITALLVIEHQRERRETDPVIDTIRFATALSGLSSLIYFMNRAAYSNMSIAHIQMILLIASWGQYALTITRSNLREKFGSSAAFFRSALSVILFGGTVWMAIEGALYVEVCFDNRADTSWQKQEYAVGLEELKQRIPENTFGFGYCVPEVWYQLGWDNICFMTDWSDINDYNLQYAVAEAKKHDAFVTTTEHQKFPGYRVEDVVTIGPYDFQLYVKKAGKTSGKDAGKAKESSADSAAASAAEEAAAAGAKEEALSAPAETADSTAVSGTDSAAVSAAESAAAGAGENTTAAGSAPESAEAAAA